MQLEADENVAKDIHGLVQCMSAMLIGVTCVEAVMIGVNKSPLDSSLRLLFVRYGEWLFVPACAFVGYTVRPFGRIRIILLAVAYLTAYSLVTQFRGSWIWDGTFDAYEYSRLPWYRASLYGIIISLIICYFPGQSRFKAAKTGPLLVALTVSSVLSAVLPRLWPADSAFASTRFLAMIAGLVGLAILLVTSKAYE